jgi:hypothetical protein
MMKMNPYHMPLIGQAPHQKMFVGTPGVPSRPRRFRRRLKMSGVRLDQLEGVSPALVNALRYNGINYAHQLLPVLGLPEGPAAMAAVLDVPEEEAVVLFQMVASTHHNLIGLGPQVRSVRLVVLDEGEATASRPIFPPDVPPFPIPEEMVDAVLYRLAEKICGLEDSGPFPLANAGAHPPRQGHREGFGIYVVRDADCT